MGGADFFEVATELHQNNEFFSEHEQALWRDHPGKYLLIYGGGQVKAFEEHGDLIEFLSGLSDIQRHASLTEWQMQGTWVL